MRSRHRNSREEALAGGREPSGELSFFYGVDIVARKRWGQAPDLVLSGPNEGQNVGAIAISSGTISAAQFAALRGLPAIALSAGQNSAGPDLDNAQSPIIAARTAELVRALDAKSKGGRMLPYGLALNINFPNEAKETNELAGAGHTFILEKIICTLRKDPKTHWS